MTKQQEELYFKFRSRISCNVQESIMALNEFFESNVCIPKGENRHPYANVLHELFEDMNKKGEVSYIGTSLGWSDFDSLVEHKFRIKPSEPIHEYQWYRITNGEVYMNARSFYTEEEAKTWGQEYFKFEETKRERK